MWPEVDVLWPLG